MLPDPFLNFRLIQEVEFCFSQVGYPDCVTIEVTIWKKMNKSLVKVERIIDLDTWRKNIRVVLSSREGWAGVEEVVEEGKIVINYCL